MTDVEVLEKMGLEVDRTAISRWQKRMAFPFRGICRITADGKHLPLLICGSADGLHPPTSHYLVPHFRQTRKQGEATVPCVLFLDNASSHAPRLADFCLGHVVTADDGIPRVDCRVKAPPCDALSDAEALERRKAFQARCRRRRSCL